MTRAVFFLALLLSSCQSYQPPGGDLWMSITHAKQAEGQNP